MRVLVVPDKFKDCLSASEAAQAMAEGVTTAGHEVDLCPMADGGEGTVDALVAATHGRFVEKVVTGPRGAPVTARFGILGDGHTAVIEMAAAAGLALLPDDQRNPMHTTTYGVGELLRAAADLGLIRIILGIGGSATTDAGVGAAQGAGMQVIGLEDQLPTGATLDRVQAVHRNRALDGIEILVACDVDNPLYGDRGAARVFGPQKGASPADVQHLDHDLAALARRLDLDPLARRPGAGAAGGLGFGMLAFFGAKLVPGIDLVMDAVHFHDRLRRCDLVLTGEGRLDASSFGGKTAVGVARACRRGGKPCAIIAGAVDSHAIDRARAEGVADVIALAHRAVSIDEAKRRARELIVAAARGITSAKPA